MFFVFRHVPFFDPTLEDAYRQARSSHEIETNAGVYALKHMLGIN
jgi:hypothetical protein